MTTSTSDIDRVTSELADGEERWARMSLGERRAMLVEMHIATARHAREWVEIALAIKGLPASSVLAGEEWSTGPLAMLTALAALADTLGALERGRSPVEKSTIRPAPEGRSSIRVAPHRLSDRVLFSGLNVRVWTRPGVDAETVRARAGLAQLRPEDTGGVAVVLGAGNIFSIPPLDVLYQLFAYNRVVVLKLNPITDRLLAVFEKIFAPAIHHGLVRIVTGGADTGSALAHHPSIAAIHMTGSAQTHDAIVFGGSAAAGTPGARRTPQLTKPITSELGGVSPAVVIPGRWSKADLRFQAEHLVSQRLHNNGYNCLATQIAVIGADWPQKLEFLDEIMFAFHRAPQRPSYYPGTAQRVKDARASYPNAVTPGQHSDRTVLLGVPPDGGEPALSTEYFGPVLGIVELPGTPREFLSHAVDLCNTQITGTLGASVIAHPETMSQLGGEFATAIQRLRYGTIAINTWTAMGFVAARAPWGAFPGHTLDDIQSGIGVVHNALLLDDTERTILEGAFRPAPRSLLHAEWSAAPKPPWFVTNKTGALTGRRITEFEATKRWTALPALLAAAMRG